MTEKIINKVDFMDSSLKNLAIKLSSEPGLIADFISTKNLENIVGGVRYEIHDGIGMYERKFEITCNDKIFRARLPLGKTFIEKEANSDEEIYQVLASHFNAPHPN